MEQETKSHYVNLAGITLPGFYVAKLETRDGTECCVVRVDLTMIGDGSKRLAMFYAVGDGREVPPVVSDSATYFGPLPLE
jgi:hypothetical protein